MSHECEHGQLARQCEICDWQNAAINAEKEKDALRVRVKELEARNAKTKDTAEKLWVLLDDIDTLGDAFKPEHTPYYKAVNARVSKRFALISSDGYNLIWPEALAAAEEGES